MNKIDLLFERLALTERKALIAYLAAGYPPVGEEEKIIDALVDGGIDALEIGVPFSDPIADGPTIQFASQEALRNGMTVKKLLAWLPKIARRHPDLPIILMGYMNPMLAYGPRFARDAAKAGVSGLIIPDLVPEESAEMRRQLEQFDLALIHLVAPTTPPERQGAISKQTRGFLYAVSVAGVTGARRALPAQTKAWLGDLSETSPAPVCVGFGISGADQIRQLRKHVDGFIVGSALIDVIRKSNKNERAKNARAFISKLSEACDGR
jgi:tryptophan synthase alpha chain